MTNRPNSIIWFERLYFGSLALALLDTILLWDEHIADFESEPELVGTGFPFFAIAWSILIIFSIALWYFVAIKAQLWAKWTQVILTALAVGALLIELLTLMISIDESGYYHWGSFDSIEWPYYFTSLYFLSTFVMIASVYMLFLPSAVSWFETRGMKIDGVFD